MGRGFGNLVPLSDFFHYSFFLDQKYPPSFYHNLWFFGAVVFMMTVIITIGLGLPRILNFLGNIGKVPLFFYCVHIGLLGIISKRIGLFYREGEVLGSLIGWVVLLAVMYPLAVWFSGVKRRTKNRFIRLI